MHPFDFRVRLYVPSFSVDGHLFYSTSQCFISCIARALKKKTRTETNLKFYKIMTVPVHLYGGETWTLRKREWNRIQAAEIKYLRTVKGCTRLYQIRNEDIRNELGISPLSEKIIEYRNKWKAHLQGMEHTLIPLQAYKYQPSGKRDIDRPRRRWRETQ
jgi:hypothetical protein